MSQPPTPRPVPSGGDIERARAFLRRYGTSGNEHAVTDLAEEFAAARFEELSAGDPRVLLPAAEPDDQLQAAARLIRRVAATALSPGELSYARLPMGEGSESVRVTSLAELEQWLGGLEERVLYGGLEQLADPA